MSATHSSARSRYSFEVGMVISPDLFHLGGQMNTRGSGSAPNEKMGAANRNARGGQRCLDNERNTRRRLIAIDHFVIAITSAGAVVRHDAPMRRG
jgi:hypothetical protein